MPTRTRSENCQLAIFWIGQSRGLGILNPSRCLGFDYRPPCSRRRPAQPTIDEGSSGKNSCKHWRCCCVFVSTNPAICRAPAISKVRDQGLTILMMTAAKGWKFGCLPKVSPGLKVNAFTFGLDHPGLIEVLTNGDMLIAEIKKQARPAKGPFFEPIGNRMRLSNAVGIKLFASRCGAIRRGSGCKIR